GGFIPGILTATALMLVTSRTSRKRGYLPARNKPATLKEVVVAARESIWALIFPILLIVGIRFGVFTPSEAGAFACVYAMFVGAVIHREMTWEDFKEAVRNSVMDVGAIMIIVAYSGIIGYGIVYDRVPQH